MNKLTYWYFTPGRGTRHALTALLVMACLVGAGVIGYTLLVPHRVEVRYGTIVRDPVDGHVWEDHTKTIRVNADKAGKYTVEYIDKLSPEHQQQQAQESAQKTAEEAQATKTQVVEPASPMVTVEQLASMKAAEQSIDTVAQSIVDGMKMLSGFAEAKTQMINYRNQIAAMPVAPEIEPARQRLLLIFDKYIQASDLFIQAIVTADMSKATQADALVKEANAMVEDVVLVAQQLKQIIDEFINILRRIFPSGS